MLELARARHVLCLSASLPRCLAASPRPNQIRRRALERHRHSRQRMQREVLALLNPLPVLHSDAQALRGFCLGEAAQAPKLGDAPSYLANELVRIDAGHVGSVAALVPRLKPSYMMVWPFENPDCRSCVRAETMRSRL